VLRPSDAYMIPFSLLWGGFAIFWEIGALRTNGPNAVLMSIWGIPFVLAGLYLIVGRFFVDAGIRAKTFYGLTNHRAIIISGLFSRTINALALREPVFNPCIRDDSECQDRSRSTPWSPTRHGLTGVRGADGLAIEKR